MCTFDVSGHCWAVNDDKIRKHTFETYINILSLYLAIATYSL